jgi:hypothetical protein
MATVQATSTAAESDEFTCAIQGGKDTREAAKLINTGTIDRYDTAWGIQPLTHGGKRYLEPRLDLASQVVPETRRRLYLSPKIVVSKIALRIEAFLDREGEYASVNTNCVHGAQVSLAFLCSLLNSRLLSFVYAEYFGALRMGGGYFQYQAPQLSVLPIRAVDFTTPQVERQRLMAKARMLYQEEAETDGCTAFHVFSGAGSSIDRQQTDVLHDLLGFLAEEMTQLHEAKRSEVKAFTAWLQEYVGVGLENLKNRTKLGDYHALEGGWAEFAAALDQNRAAVQQAKGIDVTRREPREAIREEYEASMTRLRPLLRKIELTDRLIDLIVYRLYGLTDEEIAIVEGSGKAGEIAAAGLEGSD